MNIHMYKRQTADRVLCLCVFCTRLLREAATPTIPNTGVCIYTMYKQLDDAYTVLDDMYTPGASKQMRRQILQHGSQLARPPGRSHRLSSPAAAAAHVGAATEQQLQQQTVRTKLSYSPLYFLRRCTLHNAELLVLLLLPHATAYPCDATGQRALSSALKASGVCLQRLYCFASSAARARTPCSQTRTHAYRRSGAPRRRRNRSGTQNPTAQPSCCTCGNAMFFPAITAASANYAKERTKRNFLKELFMANQPTNTHNS